MLRVLSFLFFYMAFFQSYAQFSSAQKDSVLNVLGYGSSSYTLTVGFVPNNYKADEKPGPYEKLSEKEALAKVTNTYKDAAIYKYLCLDFYYVKRDMTQAEKYFNQALTSYDEWLEKEPTNVEPFLDVLGLLYGTKSYGMLTKVLEESLNRFPKDKDVLGWAILLHLDLFKDFNKTQKYINDLLALEPYNLTACTYQVMLYQYQYIIALNQNQIPPKVDISIAEKALQAKPKEIGYQHLYHFSKVLRAYMIAMNNFMKQANGDITDYQKLFSSLNNDQIKEYKEAEKFFKSQYKKQKKARNNMLNSLGFVTMFLNKPKDAKKYYQMLYDETKEIGALESLILINFIEKNWKETERLLEFNIKEHNDIRGYTSLVSLYDKYDKNDTKKLETLKRLEQTSTSDENKVTTLSTWYLKEKNIEKATLYCDLLNPETSEASWRKLALAVLKDDIENAKANLYRILLNAPNDKDALNIKTILNL
ncbi:hypothetical protein AD998_02950 [bacterium 336/3]|nr:hypothetical protein AD998_02950 [bacterium 336/3]